MNNFFQTLALVAVVSAAGQAAHAEIRPVRSFELFEVQTAHINPSERVQVQSLTGDLIKVVATTALTPQPLQITVTSDEKAVLFPVAESDYVTEFGQDRDHIQVGVTGKVYYFKVTNAGRANIVIHKVGANTNDTQLVEVIANPRYMTMD